MGDRIALMKDGKIVQHDTPERILSAPANRFVEEFVGQDRALKRLSLHTVGSRMVPAGGDHVVTDTAPQLDSEMSLRDALSVLLSAKSDVAQVRNKAGTLVGALRLEDVHAAAAG